MGENIICNTCGNKESWHTFIEELKYVSSSGYLTFFKVELTIFPPLTTIVVCSSSTLEAYIANNMDPDQTAPIGAVWSGFIVFASIIKVVWYMQQTL